MQLSSGVLLADMPPAVMRVAVWPAGALVPVREKELQVLSVAVRVKPAFVRGQEGGRAKQAYPSGDLQDEARWAKRQLPVGEAFQQEAL